MRNKIIQYLQEEKTVINVRSEKQWIELMEYFEFYDFKYGSKTNPTTVNFWWRLGEETSISLGVRGDERIGYCYINYYIQKLNYSSILFKDFKKEFIEKDIAYQLHLAKKHVEALEKQLREETTKYYVIFKLGEKKFNYLNYDDYNKGYFINSKDEDKDYKTQFTQKELEDLNVWDNPLFEIEEVK